MQITRSCVMRCPKNLFCGVKVHYINKIISHHRRMAQWYFYCTYYGWLHEVRRQAWWLFPLGAVREIPFALFASKWFRDETAGAISANWHFHCSSEAIVFSQIGDASYKCQPEHGTHSYGCISRGFATPQLSLCALRKQLLRANNSRTVS